MRAFSLILFGIAFAGQMPGFAQTQRPASPWEMAIATENWLVEGAGARFLPGMEGPAREDDSFVFVDESWPAAFQARVGESVYLSISKVTGCYEFTDSDGRVFWMVVPDTPLTWDWITPFLSPLELAAQDLFSPFRLVREWRLTTPTLEAMRVPPRRSAPRRSAPVSTNLCFTALSIANDVLVFTADWPEDNPLPDATLDLYGKTNLLSRTWSLLSSHPATNKPASFSIPMSDLPWPDSIPHVHDAACDSTTNFIASPLDENIVYTNIVYGCGGFDPVGQSVFFTLGTRADADGDGLADAFELFVSLTNPEAVDSDGDGMNDGWESRHDGFDPAVDNSTDANPNNDPDADPDGDSLANGEESEANTNPGEPDSDGDGLDDGAEIGQGSDPNDSADMIPVKWVSVTGDLDQNVHKQVNETVTIPAGTIAFIGVFLFSEEYPVYTGKVSEFNDKVAWSIQAAGNTPIEGLAYVNNEDGAWDEAGEKGHTANGFSPVVLKDKAVYAAPVDTDLSVSVSIDAMNVSDGELPTTVLVGVFPLKVVQFNMPTAIGLADTTDAEDFRFRAFIPANGVAYITAEPAAPHLTAQFKNLPQWIDVTWSGSLTTERADKRFDGIDNRTLPQVTLAGSEAYGITSGLQNEIIGGACAIDIRIGDATAITYPFSIRGKNPPDAVARAYITANVDAEFRPYAWMIAKHESMNTGNRVYNQFNAAGAQKEKPNWGAPHGWGIAQIDKGRNGDSTAEVYDWHANVASMNATLREKLAEYRQFIRWYREVYQNDCSTSWIEPDGMVTNIDGYVVSAEMWGVMNCYNGKGGIPPQNIGLHLRQKSPLQFDPASTNWIFHTNANDYVPKVLNDRNRHEEE